MRQIITSQFSSINTHSSVRSPTTIKTHRKYLPPQEFKLANQQKVMWLKASVKECILRGNEIHVLEALAFLTDPVTGKGDPAIGAIQEKAQEWSAGIHYATVMDCLKRLEQKGAIIKERRSQKTNMYTLVGYEYKSESYCEKSRDNINSLSVKEREREIKIKRERDLDISKTNAPANARIVSMPDEEKYDPATSWIRKEGEDYTTGDKIKAMTKRERKEFYKSLFKTGDNNELQC